MTSIWLLTGNTPQRWRLTAVSLNFTPFVASGVRLPASSPSLLDSIDRAKKAASRVFFLL
jgi:hypothetical protein